MNLNRRNVLKAAGASMATGVAGCLGSNEAGNGNGNGNGIDLPGYHRWLTTDSNGSLSYIYVDWNHLSNLESGNQSTTNATTDSQSDPMLGLPLTGMMAAAFVVGFGLSAYGLSGMVNYSQSGTETDESEDLSSKSDAMLSTNEAIVLTGEIDTEEVDGILTAEPEGFSLSKQYEQTDEIDDYDVYTPVDEEGSEAIAVSDSALVFTSGDDITEPVDAIRTPIEAAAGETERATAESDDLEWLVSTAGHGHLVLGGYGETFESPSESDDESGDDVSDIGSETQDEFNMEYSELEGVDGGVSSLTFDDTGSQASGKFAAILGDGDASALEDSLGSSAAESSVEIEDGRVTASATWESLD
ncbi:twin-arginine translocation signal domain-containing protein [Haloarchaeobius amylolyticus]|uniref:Twin-arginine translocation signal domain-containing protein n=1 Tax=Haloarchaeobius amylolyticus TaxID=1198296 RepID=A0ABD6BDN0_9EURY